MVTPKETAMTLLTVASNKDNFGAGLRRLLDAAFAEDLREVGADLPDDASEGDVWAVIGPFVEAVCLELTGRAGFMVHQYGQATGVPVEESLAILRDKFGDDSAGSA